MRAWQQARGMPLSPPVRPEDFADHIKPIVLLALNTGLRRGDLFSLEWHHVDFNNRQIRKVINKTRRKNTKLTPAVLPLSPEACKALKTWQDQTTDVGLVFPSPVTGKALDNINKAWNGVVKDAGIENFRFHDLRHSFASKLVMGGIPLNTVRELMTHSTMDMTLVYAHLSPSHKEDAINKVFGEGPAN
jgi:integrase